jgi:transcriptional regulator
MHIPSKFRDDDLARAQRTMRDHPFALLVTAHAGATHLTWLPFLLDATRGASGTLEAHLARVNPHAEALLAGAPSTVAFLGPHGYVSPRWYAEPSRQVPTWNYVAVHAHGRPQAVTEPGALLAMVARLSDAFERGRTEPWTVAEAQRYAEQLAPHIVGFTLPIERLEHQRKLSQNRSAADRAGVLAALATPDAAALRQEMLELYSEGGEPR